MSAAALTALGACEVCARVGIERPATTEARLRSGAWAPLCRFHAYRERSARMQRLTAAEREYLLSVVEAEGIDPRVPAIVVLRAEGQTLVAAGAVVGVSRERARQLAERFVGAVDAASARYRWGAEPMPSPCLSIVGPIRRAVDATYRPGSER